MKLHKKKLTLSLNQSKVESIEKNISKKSYSNKKIPMISITTSKKDPKNKPLSEVNLKNFCNKKLSKNIPLINIKKQIFSSSVITPSSTSPIPYSKNKKKNSTNLIKKDSFKNSFSYGITNTETISETPRTTFLKKNSSYETTLTQHQVSKFSLGSSFRTICSDDCIKYIDLMNKIKALFSIEGSDKFLFLNDEEIKIKSPSIKRKTISRNNSDILYTPNKEKKALQKKAELELIFCEIESLFKSVNKVKLNSFINNNNEKNSSKENKNDLNIKLESDNRISIYNKLFNICSEKLNEISKIILESYHESEKSSSKKTYFNSIKERSDEKIQFNNLEIDLNESSIHEGITSARLPTPKIISVNLPNEKKQSNISERIDNTKIETICEFDMSLIKENFNTTIKDNKKIIEYENEKKKCNIF